ncbi:MAG: hypothetical protein Ta2F_14970 [Termitinemataceae bacterium]|nr:MAG: hypothetical protein Ta2F_14970 [Termitinemataceae bacterium]
MKNLPLAGIVAFCCLTVILTCKGTDLVPVKKAEVVGGYNVFPYSPTYEDNYNPKITYKYGEENNRINPVGINIKSAYKTSDGVDHIVLRGRVKSGIPIGLIWSDSKEAPEDIGGYFGRGDFTESWFDTTAVIAVPGSTHPVSGDKTLPAAGDDSFSLLTAPDATNPIFAKRFEPKELDREWSNKAAYTAVTLSGLLNDNKNTTITEINDALHLYNKKYREDHYPDYATFFTNDIWYRKTIPGHNPNNFLPADTKGIIEEPDGEPRGGYMFLISEAANPKVATFEIEYQDGAKQTVIIDYSEVEFSKESIPLENDAGPTTFDAGFEIFELTSKTTPILTDTTGSGPLPANTTLTSAMFENGTWSVAPVPTPITSQKIDFSTTMPTSGETFASADFEPEDDDDLLCRLWFNYHPWNSTCKVSEVVVVESSDGVDAFKLDVYWDEFDTLVITSTEGAALISGGGTVFIVLSLKLSEPYYYDSDEPDKYIDTILLNIEVN